LEAATGILVKQKKKKDLLVLTSLHSTVVGSLV